MSFFLSARFDFADEKITKQYAEMIDRMTRPIFPEDVPDGLMAQYEAIDQQEFADQTEVSGTQITLCWFDKERFDFVHLIPMLKLKEAQLVLAYEIPSYGDSGDTEEEEYGWFWVTPVGSDTSKTNSYQQVDKKKAIELTSAVVVKQLMEFGD